MTLDLSGKQIAIAGRLVSMPRRRAAALITSRGAVFSPRLTRTTEVLIVGAAPNGTAMPRRVHQAMRLRRRGQSIEIVPEVAFFAQMADNGPAAGVRCHYTLAEMADLLQVPGDRLQAWVRARLLIPVDIADGLELFDFHQVSTARRLQQFMEGGLTVEQIRQRLQRLRAFPVAATLTHGRLLARRTDGRLADTHGQLHFDFAAEQEATAGKIATGPTAAEWYELGCQSEAEDRLVEAAHAYRQALLRGGPDTDAAFNLANVLYRQGRKEAAVERLRQVIEIDPLHIEAWNNLGVMLAEQGDHDEAESAFRAALEAQPTYADAHYNLADLLDSHHRAAEARPHWEAFLRQKPADEAARYARRRLESSDKLG